MRKHLRAPDQFPVRSAFVTARPATESWLPVELTVNKELFTYHRQVRTPYSEIYEIRTSDTRVGRVDLHYAAQDVYATLILENETDENGVLAIIEDVDENLVLSSEMPRQDLLVSVYNGSDVGLYNDDFLRERVAQEARGNGSAG